MTTSHLPSMPGWPCSPHRPPRAGSPPQQDRSPSGLCRAQPARSVRGTHLRIADLRSRPAYISLADTSAAQTRRVATHNPPVGHHRA